MTKAKNRRIKSQAKRRKNLLSANPEGWNIHTEYHWSKSVCGLRFDYWPSSKKAMFNNTVYNKVDNVNDLEKHLSSSFGRN